MLWCWFKVYLKLNKSLFFISSPLWNGFKRCQSYRLQPDSCLVSQISPQITISTTLHLDFFSSLATFSVNAFIQCAGGTKTSKCCQCLSTFEYAVVAIFWVDFVVWWSHRLIISDSLEYTHMYTQIQMSSQKLPKHTCALSSLKSFSFASHIYSFPSEQAMCKQDLEVYCIL